MVVSRRVVELKLTQAEAELVVLPPGISVLWLDWKPESVVAEFIASDMIPDPTYRRNLTDIRHLLGTTFRNRLLNDNIGAHPNSPRRAMMVEAYLDHPYLTGKSARGSDATPRELKRAAETATDIHEIELSSEQARRNFRLESTGERLEILPKEVRQKRELKQIGGHGRGEIQYQEVYGPEREIYLSGVVDVG